MSSPRRRQWKREVQEAERQRKAAQFKSRIGRKPATPRTSVLGPGASVRIIDTPVYRAPAPTPPPPVFSQCVVGYRMWYVDPFMRLRSVSVDRVPWQPGVNVAECHATTHGLRHFGEDGAPGHECHCGFYAYADASVSTTEVDFAYKNTKDINEVIRPVVFGSVAGWGTMEVHRDGWRAEKVAVTALATLPSMAPEVVGLTEAVADRYEVPVVPGDLLTLEAERHGQVLPHGVIPAPDPEDPFAAMVESMSKLQRQLFQGYAAKLYGSNAASWLPKS